LALAVHTFWVKAIKPKGEAMKFQVVTNLVAVITTAAIAGGLTTQAAAQTASVRRIVVSLEDRKLALVEDGQVKKVYTVAVGKATTPSPQGSFTIQRRVVNPTYQHNGRTVAPGTSNPVGSRWMGLSIRGYGIHGTNEPNSIGKAASHGCIRMGKADLEEFYALVNVGDQVEIIGQRNEETARLFEPAAPIESKRTEQLAGTERAKAIPASTQ
jgi:lipoprotein-anchoring transpeptidase ErfK/SrfK